MRKMMKNSVVFLLVITLIFSSVLIVSADNGQAAIPVRSFFEELGADVQWDMETRLVIITLEENTYVLVVGSNIAYKNNDAVTLQENIYIKQNKSFIAAADLETLLSAESRYLGAAISTATLGAMQFMEPVSISGMTIVIVDAENDFTWTGGFGYADVDKKTPVDENTLFGLASISKTFTAVAVMQLVESGVLDIDKPVTTYLPDFKLPADLVIGEGDYRNITPRMLLAHASGIQPDIVGLGVLTSNNYNKSYMDNFIKTVSEFPMLTPENYTTNYSNNAFTLLGVLVAELMGYDSYFNGFVSYTSEKIFKPLGMEMTTFALEEKHMPYVAQPHLDAETRDEFLYYNAIPAGGIFSNANDMARYMHALLNGGIYEESRILSESSVEKMFTIYELGSDFSPGLIVNMRPGLGIMQTASMDGFTYSGHNGNLVHYHSSMLFDTDSKLGVFISTNSITGMYILEALTPMILKTAVYEKTGVLNLPLSDSTVKPITLSEEELLPYVGFYTVAGADDLMTVAVIEKSLTVMFPGIPFPMTLIPMSNGSFYNEDTELYFRFEVIQGEMIVYIGEFKTHLIGARYDADIMTAADDFEQWVGTYYPVIGEGEVSIVTQVEVGIDARGFSHVMLYTMHGQTSYSPLIAIGEGNDNNYLGGLSLYKDGNDTYLVFSGLTLKKK